MIWNSRAAEILYMPSDRRRSQFDIVFTNTSEERISRTQTLTITADPVNLV